MIIPLRRNTARTLKLGPFLDRTNAADRETALTIAAADVLISKNDGAFAAKNDAGAATHNSRGHYDVPFNATDTNTLGRLKIDIENANALPFDAECWVFQENVYDALFAGTEYLEVTTLAHDFTIVGSTLTVRRRDGTTTQFTKTISTTPGADPVTGLD
jgi:hypothetical protein